MSALNYESYLSVLNDSEKLFDNDTIMNSITNIAGKINEQIEKEREIPIFLTLMQGGMMFAMHTMSYVNHPIELDYIHVSRYHNNQFGSSQLEWIKSPEPHNLKGRNVYVLDDIIDAGITLKTIKKFVLQDCQAKSCQLVVLIDKKLPPSRKVITADIAGLISPDMFLYGFGMDLKGVYRNLPDIYYTCKTRVAELI